MSKHPRRLRENEILREMVRETRVSAKSLILPFFVRDGMGIAEPIASLPGLVRYSPDTVSRGVSAALSAGVRSIMLFGVPAEKDAEGSGAYAENGVVQQAVRRLKRDFGNDAYIITDVCLCEYTSHGHCGMIKGQRVDNDATLPLLARTALSHASAGADMVAPSDMMDGRVAAIRAALDANGFPRTPVMSYAAKYASSFYGPFREAAGSAPRFTDGPLSGRNTYQMDYHNGREALREVALDVEEGADIIIVKPALSYLDVIKEVSGRASVPVAAYSVSGEYAMIKAAAHQNLINEYGVMCETAVSIFRAGASLLVTYYAKELAEAIKKGDIG